MLRLGPSAWGIALATGLIGSVMHTGSTPSPSQGASGGSQQVQLQKQEEVVSQSEAQELKRILRKLKTLALETETELERQDETLDVITSSVDRATMNIDKQNRRIKKLT
ncbi:synaptosomal-associated protein 47-like [Sphaerodactylus townsendi]|uniref:synaptosomal-associated protein 47-like n=1 Tax=Sphaerodactylus townsendi TaxID=933632 RepID=UPI002025BBEB|nr:synaptosomal-associated protein 47-like [Sphaerodactylus townsendi]